MGGRWQIDVTLKQRIIHDDKSKRKKETTRMRREMEKRGRGRQMMLQGQKLGKTPMNGVRLSEQTVGEEAVAIYLREEIGFNNQGQEGMEEGSYQGAKEVYGARLRLREYTRHPIGRNAWGTRIVFCCAGSWSESGIVEEVKGPRGGVEEAVRWGGNRREKAREIKGGWAR